MIECSALKRVGCFHSNIDFEMTTHLDRARELGHLASRSMAWMMRGAWCRLGAASTGGGDGGGGDGGGSGVGGGDLARVVLHEVYDGFLVVHLKTVRLGVLMHVHDALHTLM